VVVRTLAFLVLRRILDVVGCAQAPDTKDVEIAVLRQAHSAAYADSSRCRNDECRDAAKSSLGHRRDQGTELLPAPFPGQLGAVIRSVTRG
jgi:hypothetical protein